MMSYHLHSSEKSPNKRKRRYTDSEAEKLARHRIVSDKRQVFSEQKSMSLQQHRVGCLQLDFFVLLG